MNTAHLFLSFPIEVPAPRNSRPSYRWAPGWAAARPGVATTQPLRLREWQAMARRDGFRIVRHATEAEARAAVIADPT